MESNTETEENEIKEFKIWWLEIPERKNRKIGGEKIITEMRKKNF